MHLSLSINTSLRSSSQTVSKTISKCMFSSWGSPPKILKLDLGLWDHGSF